MASNWMRRGLGLAALVALVAPAFLGGPAVARAGQQPGHGPEIVVLSNRADLISGGDALVEVILPSAADPERVRVDIDGRDVTSSFDVRPNGRFMGLVDGLKEWENVLNVRRAGGSARITITNHPVGGPIFSGPQLQPWICTTEENGLGPALDEQCNAPTKVEWFYQSSNPVLAEAGFQPYDPSSPPNDVATTTTDEGNRVPFIVRLETGTMNRGIYRFAMLAHPDERMTPWEDNPAWNSKLYTYFTGGSAPNQTQGELPDLFNEGPEASFVLSRGWAVGVSTMTMSRWNSSMVTAAETAMMVKERIAESAGPIRYSVATGCSNGSVLLNPIVGAYPGIFDGILQQCTARDRPTVHKEFLDCSLLERYYDQTSPHLWSLEPQRAAVNGYAVDSVCAAVLALDRHRTIADPTTGCTQYYSFLDEPDWVYHPEDNPDGARCTEYDHMVAQYGRRPPESWDRVEQEIGRGFANRYYDNVGVQYGLRVLESGLITTEQFVDLNEKIGAYDIDLNWQPQRTRADAFALEAAYRTGDVAQGYRMDSVPIIDVRTHSNAIHVDAWSWSMRARYEETNGHHANQVMWNELGVGEGRATPERFREAFVLMDEWLSAIQADSSTAPREEKVVTNKPAAAVDACWIAGRKITDQSICRGAFPYFAFPRVPAGSPLSDMILKCQLKPLDRADYDVEFTDDQWARLQGAFPDGVCDWSKPSVGQQPSVPWLTYEAGAGGEPLGRAPVSQVSATPNAGTAHARPPGVGGGNQPALSAAAVGADASALPATGGGTAALAAALLLLAAASRRRMLGPAAVGSRTGRQYPEATK